MPQDPFADPQESSTTSDPFADPEDLPTESISETVQGQATRAKLLTHMHDGLDVTIGDVDFVSSDVISGDVNDLRVPKGVICPHGITPTRVSRVEGEDGECPLCEAPEVLGQVEIIDKMNKGWVSNAERKAETVKGKEKGIFAKTAKIGSAAVKSLKSVASGKGKKSEIRSVEYSTIGEGEDSGGKSSEDKKKKKKEKKERPATLSMYNAAGPSMYPPMWGP